MKLCIITFASISCTWKLKKWSLPVFGNQFQPTQAQAETAFNGTLQSYHLLPSTTQANTDLAEFMLQHKSESDLLIEQKLSQESQNFILVLIFNSENRVKTKIRKMSLLRFMQIRSWHP